MSKQCVPAAGDVPERVEPHLANMARTVWFDAEGRIIYTRWEKLPAPDARRPVDPPPTLAC